MGKYIVKLEGKYLEWSTIVDAPITFGMTLEEFRKYYKDEWGRQGMNDLDRRLVRVEEKGTSAFDSESAEDTILLNRAGPKEKSLHHEEIIEFYCRRRKEPTEKTLAEFRKGLKRCGPKCPAIPDKDGGASFCPKCWGTDYVRETHSPPEDPIRIIEE